MKGSVLSGILRVGYLDYVRYCVQLKYLYVTPYIVPKFTYMYYIIQYSLTYDYYSISFIYCWVWGILFLKGHYAHEWR